MSGNHPQGGPGGPDYGGHQGPSYLGPGSQGSAPGHQPPQGPGQPQGPGYGTPGQGGYGQPGYGGPQDPGPQGTGGYDSAPGGYGQPGSAASANQPGYGGAGYGSYSPTTGTTQPMGPGGPPKKSNGPMIALIAGIGAVVVIAAIIAGVVLTRGNTTAGPGGGESTAPAEAQYASDAVRGYLEAIAANDAETALSYAQAEPVDKTFLTNEVLQASSEIAAITEINVPEVTDEYAYEVPASFKIGEQRVNVDIRVESSGDSWLIDDVSSKIDLSRISSGMTVSINGTEATAATVYLFPGTYVFDTGNKYVSFLDGKDTIIVSEPSSYASVSSDLEIGLTEAGNEFMVTEAKKSLQACVAKKELAPAGCPFQALPNLESGRIKLNLNTMKFTMSDDGLSDATPRPDYDDPTKVTMRVYPTVKYYVEGTRDAEPVYFDASARSTDTTTASVDFSEAEPKLTWVS